MDIRTITRTEYQQLAADGYAGPANSLLEETEEGWPGTHWILTRHPDIGESLVPVNIAEIG